MNDIDYFAVWIGRSLMVAAGLLIASVALGWAAHRAWKRAYKLGLELRSIYSAQVLRYWLGRLEKEGERCFERALAEDAAKYKEKLAAMSIGAGAAQVGKP